MRPLTEAERYATEIVLRAVAVTLVYDPVIGDYIDNGKFILTLTLEEKQNLLSTIRKLCEDGYNEH